MTNKEETALVFHADSSKIFRRNRSMGYVSNKVPAVVRYVRSRRDTLIVTCIGRSFQVYTARHFRLIHVGPVHPNEITAMAIDRLHTYTASEKCIYAWKAGKHKRHVFRGHTEDVHLLLPFGSHLIAVDEANVMKVWSIAEETVYLEVPFKKDEFEITALSHPPTYLNKILLGSQQGQLKMWNVKEDKLVYTFAGRSSRVSCLEAAPALDVVAVGYQDGTILLLNLKFDEEIMDFKQDWGPVTRITFRTDGVPVMASASTNGNIAFWNLEERKISSQIQAHEDSVTTAIGFPNEPLLLTTSPDNSMKLWVFDMPDGGVRLLRIREGHTSPPLCIRYHGSGGTSILSAGEDSALRVFSTISETLNKSMGKASYNRKISRKKNRFEEDNLRMPPIIGFTSETTREKEWDNIAAIHAGIIQTTTWSFHKNRMGSHRLIPEKFQNKNRVDYKTETTCLTLTHCGNFVVIGYSNGCVERFNLQSGIHRASYGSPAHKQAIRGVASDILNQFIISGCSGGLLRFWPFKGNVSKPSNTLKMIDGIEQILLHRESAMIAVALVSFVTVIVDADTRAVIRKFEGHTAKINDMTFSPDSRWLITAAMDATIKVWDILSSYMIDHFKVERPCLSLSMSPTGDFLATAHVNCLGIYLWSNKTLFSEVSIRSIDPYSEAPYVSMSANDYTDGTFIELFKDLSMEIEETEGVEVNSKYETPSQLSSDLITMSGLATSRWQNLLDLDIIKKRNKPKTAPKVPKQAPFFLPTVAGLEMKFDLPTATAENSTSKVLQSTNISNLTFFSKLLENLSSEEDYEKCVAHLKSLGPSMIDFEIRSLNPLGGGSYRIMVNFLKIMKYIFSTNNNFELAQSYLSVFLRVYGLNLLESPEVMDAMESVKEAQESSWKRIEEKLVYSMGVVAALRNLAS